MDRQIRWLGLGMLALFVVLFAQVNYIQVFAASDLRNHPANVRRIYQEYNVDRGEILARDRRTILAESVPTKGKLKFLRRYPNGPLYAGITGYYSLVYGRSGLEQTYNEYLAAHATELLATTIRDDILDRPKRGAFVVTTIDPQLQQVAANALQGRAGGIAALDPRTGEVLALVSEPSYDPNLLSSHKPKEIRAAWSRLNDHPDEPLLSNATDQLYPPGSTFKVIDTAAVLEGAATPQTEYPGPE